MSFTYREDPHIRYVANQSEGEMFTLQTGQLSCVMRPGTIFPESAPQPSDAEKDGRCRGGDREDRDRVSDSFPIYIYQMKSKQYVTSSCSLHLKWGHKDVD